MKVGTQITFKGLDGIVRFSGNTHFAEGVWLGIELREPAGRNDGSVEGTRYFECKEGHGIFVRETALHPLKQQRTADPLSEVDKLKGIIEKLQTRSKAVRSEVKLLNTRVGELEEHRSNLTEELELITVDNETLKEQNELLEYELNELRKENSELLIKTDNLNKELRHYIQSVAAGSTESLAVDNSKLTNELYILRESNSKMEKELRELRATLLSFNELQIKYSAISEELIASKSIIEELSSNMESSNHSGSIVESLTLKNQTLIEENNTLKVSIKEFEDLKQIEMELDKENDELIQQLNQQISANGVELKNKTTLIKKLKLKLHELQKKESSPSLSASISETPPNSNDDTEDLKSIVIKAQTDKLKLELDIEYLKFQAKNRQEQLETLEPQISTAPGYKSINLQNFRSFFLKMGEFITFDNSEIVIDLICVKIRYYLQILSERMEALEQTESDMKQLIMDIDEHIESFVQLVKDGDFHSLLSQLSELCSNVQKPTNSQFRNRTAFEEMISQELASAQMIYQIVKMCGDNQELSPNFTRLFKAVKTYEGILMESSLNIAQAKKDGNELVKEQELHAIDLNKFFNQLMAFYSSGYGVIELNTSLMDLVSVYGMRTSNFHIDWEWKHIYSPLPEGVILKADMNVLSSKLSTLSLENELKSTEIQELNIKINVLNSKLENYKHLSRVVNEYKAKNEDLNSENSRIMQNLADYKEENDRYAKIVSQSSNSLILNNFEFDNLIGFKQKLGKLDLISEIQSLRRSIRYFVSLRNKKDYTWLRRELPKFKPFQGSDEIEELRKIGRDMRREAKASKCLKL